MDGERSSKPGTSSRATTVCLVVCAIAIGLMMASTGRNGNRCGCPFPCNAPAALSRSERIVAYCFHKNERSPASATVETFTREAIEAGFSDPRFSGSCRRT